MKKFVTLRFLRKYPEGLERLYEKIQAEYSQREREYMELMLLLGHPWMQCFLGCVYLTKNKLVNSKQTPFPSTGVLPKR